MNVAGMPVPWVEQGIMASVLILGLMVAAAGRFPTSASLSLVGFFAIFHGFAHAAEMHKARPPWDTPWASSSPPRRCT